MGRCGVALGAFVDEWWAAHAHPGLESSTLHVYRHVWERHARSRLGGLAITEVTPLTIAGFRATLEDDGVGAESIRETLRMLRSVFQRAVERELIRSNPVRAV